MGLLLCYTYVALHQIKSYVRKWNKGEDYKTAD